MKKYLLTLLILCIISSCTTNAEEELEIIDYACTPATEVNGWQRMQFNYAHTISIPNDYGDYNFTQKNGIYFMQRKTGDMVVINGGHCDEARTPCLVHEYRDKKTIEDNATTAEYYGNSGIVNFSNRILVCQDGVPVAYFFYDLDTGPTFRDSYGEIYLKDPNDDIFKMAGYVQFAKSLSEETFNIIKSIKAN